MAHHGSVLPLLLPLVSDAPQDHDGASVTAVLVVMFVMCLLFCGLIWLAVRAARRSRRAPREWADWGEQASEQVSDQPGGEQPAEHIED